MAFFSLRRVSLSPGFSDSHHHKMNQPPPKDADFRMFLTHCPYICVSGVPNYSAAMKRPPEIAVLGCGGWGRNIVRTLEKLSLLRAVADTTPEGRALATKLAPEATIHNALEPLLDDPDIRGVMIATPAEFHYQHACQSLAAGKDVFVEKPMTINVDEARDLIDRAEKAERILMVGHLLEYHPAIRKLHAMILSGELGDIQYVVSNRLNLGKIRTRENALWSFAPHDIAVILRLVGVLPLEIVATGGSYITPDIADVTVTQILFENGVRSHIFVSWLHPFKEQRLVVIGSKKMASFDDIAKELILYDQRVDWQAGQPVPVRGKGTPVDFSPEQPLAIECRHFSECIRTRKTPLTDGANGLRVLQILHAAQESLEAGGRPTSPHIDQTTEIEVYATDNLEHKTLIQEIGAGHGAIRSH